MIGFLRGKVLFSDGHEVLLVTGEGVGYQVRGPKFFLENEEIKLYITHIVRENSQELFGFSTFREKKLFEMILEVKGIGSRGAYSLVQTLGFEGVLNAIVHKDKKSLQKSPGIGAKGAAQILLDGEGKVKKLAIHRQVGTLSPQKFDRTKESLLNDAIMACSELGFSEDQTILRAQHLLSEHEINKPEQLVHLILKDMGMGKGK